MLLRNNGSALVVTVAATGERITVGSAYDSYGFNTGQAIEEIRLADGTLWNDTALKVEAVKGTGAADSIYGFGGNDVISSGLGNDWIAARAGNDSLDGGEGNDTLLGERGADTLLGGAGDDALYGNSSSWDSYSAVTDGDTFDGGAGNDTIYDYETTNGDAYRLNLGGGADSVYDGGGSADRIEVGAGILQTDLVVTRSGSNLQVAIAGAVDRMTVTSWFASTSNQLESFTFDDNSVWDATRIAASVLGAVNGTIAVDTLVGTVNADWLQGLDGNDTLDGAAGNDRLDGGIGADTMRGGVGDDIYEVDNIADVLVENANEGVDTVRSLVAWTLGANFEDLALTGTAAVNATGNTLTNRLWGNDAANRIDGGTGADTMSGRGGNDTYVVDNALDIVVEAMGGGVDTVEAGITYALAANVENLTLTGTTAINATGNELDNLLTGNAAANALTGGAGNDALNGGAGNDSMAGGLGNDSYTVDSVSDVITEAVNEGTDSVTASVTWTLGANVENLTLSGATNLNGTGNALDNVIVGNAGNNTLSGGAGNDVLDGGAGTDTMTGSTGNDVYRIDATRDKATENTGEGIDRIESSITWALGANFEDLTLTGNAIVDGTGNTLDNVLIGNAAANVLTGGAGNDTLDGGAGNDTLVGGAGADTYRFGVGKGIDTVQENDTTAGVTDRVDFGALLQSQIAFQRTGNNLEALIVGNTADKLVLKDWYLGTQYHVEQFAFGDGSVFSDAQVQSLVSAMAVFAPETASIEPVMMTNTSHLMFDRVGSLAVQAM